MPHLQATIPAALSSPPSIKYMGRGSYGPESKREYLLTESWAIHLYNYESDISLGGSPWYRLRPGMIGITPPGVTARYRWRQRGSIHAAAHFHLPPGSETRELPILVDFHSDYAAWHDHFQAAIEYFPLTPRRADAMLWSLLWALVERGRTHAATGRDHPVVVSAVGYIERHLDGPLSVAATAQYVDLSHNQLTRLFRQAFGQTVVGYIRRRRAERALRLLQDTSLPIKAVAVDVGVPDLQQFNKLIRREFGRSPRQVRA